MSLERMLCLNKVSPWESVMTSWKIILSVLAFLCCSGLLVFLPSLRSKRWEHTHHSTKHQITPKTQEELNEELEIEKASAVDDSQFAQSLGIRYIQRIPTSKVALEAVFRQRRSDASVMLPPSEPLFVTRFLREPIGLEQSNKTMRLSATRRAVFSIGLEMHGSDIAQIPWLSRSTIVDFIQGHYVSLQTRILKDERSDEWFLHHRPIAAVAKFGAIPLTHEFVSPITETVADIRGLGVLIDRDPMDELVRQLGLPTDAVTATLAMLEVRGLVRRDAGASYTLTRPHGRL